MTCLSRSVACPVGFYGMNCSESCGFCKNRSDCDHVNGLCPNGCQSGYKDEKCELSKCLIPFLIYT